MSNPLTILQLISILNEQDLDDKINLGISLKPVAFEYKDGQVNVWCVGRGKITVREMLTQLQNVFSIFDKQGKYLVGQNALVVFRSCKKRLFAIAVQSTNRNSVRIHLRKGEPLCTQKTLISYC